MTDWSAQTIVMVGGLGLIGKSITSHLLQLGASIVIADSDLQSYAEFARTRDPELQERKLKFFQCDITREKQVQAVIEGAEEAFGGINGVVNCAYPKSKGYGDHLFDVKYDNFCSNVNIHLGGFFLVSQLFARYFCENGGGSIVNLASIYGAVAPKFDIYAGTKMTMPVEYAAIKSGIIHISRYIAAYCKDKGVRVNTLSPGGIADGQPNSFLEAYQSHCLSKGMLAPGDLNGLTSFLLSDEAQFINGQNIIIDDGFTL